MAERIPVIARVAVILLLAATFLFALAMAWNADGWPVSLAEAAIFAASAITALRATAIGTVRFTWSVLALCVACLWILLQLCFGVSSYKFATFQWLLEFWSITCLFWCLLQLFPPSTSLRRPRQFLIVVGALTAAFSIAYICRGNGKMYWFIETSDTWQPAGFFLNRDHNCVFLEMILPLAAWEAFSATGRAYLYAAAAALMYGCVVMSGSRAGTLLATLELTVLLYCGFRRRRLKRHKTALNLCILAVSAILGIAMLYRSPGLRGLDMKALVQQRKELLQSTAMMIGERPLMGFGMGTWAITYPRFALFEPGLAVYHAHNDWAEWMAEGGVPFVLLLWAVLIRGILSIPALPWGLGAAAAACHAFVDFPFHVYVNLLCLFLVLSLLEAATTQPKTKFRFRRSPFRERSSPILAAEHEAPY